MIDDAIQLNFHLNNGNHSYDDVHSAIALHAHQPSKSQLNILNFYSIKNVTKQHCWYTNGTFATRAFKKVRQ